MAAATSRRLQTHFGTILFVDERAMELRHGPILSSPDNVQIEPGFGEARLLFLPQDATPGTAPRPVTLLPNGGFVGERTLAVGAQWLTLHSLPRGLIALGLGPLFVSAEPDGRITLSREHRREWETFLPLPAPALARMRHLARNTWVARSGRQVVPARSIRFDAGFRMVIGGLEIDLREPAAVATPAADEAPEPGVLDLLHDGWRLERLYRYQPLIYFAAFGHDGIFDCLELALASLARFAEWRDTVLIITDRSAEELAPFIPAELQRQVHVHRCNPVDLLGFTLARYRLDQVPLACHHQPMLYVDTDVMFDRPLTDLMTDILLSDQVSFLAEREMFDYDFYGEPLFHADGGFRPSYTRGLSSGAIGIPSWPRAAERFRAVTRVADAYAGTAGTRDVFNCFDQPFANYVFHKLGGFDPVLLERHASLHHSSYADAADRKGFVHFCGGVGVSAPKLVRMAQYFDDLAALEKTTRDVAASGAVAP